MTFADKVQEIATDSFANVAETQKRRKACKEATDRYEQEMLVSLKTLAKAEQKYQTEAQNWEKALHGAEMVEMEQGFNATPVSPLKKSLFKTQTPQEKVRAQVDDAIRKTDAANVAFNLQVAHTNRDRRDYLTQKIPSVVQNLKRIVDDSDANLQFNLQKYAIKYEERLMADATTLSPIDSNAGGLRMLVDRVRNDVDLAEFVKLALTTSPPVMDVTAEYVPRASEVIVGSLKLRSEKDEVGSPFVFK